MVSHHSVDLIILLIVSQARCNHTLLCICTSFLILYLILNDPMRTFSGFRDHGRSFCRILNLRQECYAHAAGLLVRISHNYKRDSDRRIDNIKDDIAHLGLSQPNIRTATDSARDRRKWRQTSSGKLIVNQRLTEERRRCRQHTGITHKMHEWTSTKFCGWPDSLWDSE